MRIRGWAIEQFGVLRHYEVRDLRAGLTVLFGPNGAGKRTLQTFLIGMLFGFEGLGNGCRKALQTTGVGGRLFCSGPAGDYVIERRGEYDFALRLVLPDGREGTENDLDIPLRTNGRRLRSIFAFTNQELHSFQALKAAGVGDLLSSNASGEAAQLARRPVRDIRRRAGRLLGRQGLIHTLADELSDLASQVERARAETRGSLALVQAEEQCRVAIAQLDARMAKLCAERSGYETLLQVWSPWSELVQARRELADLDDVDTIPPGSAARLERLTAAVAEARRILQDAEAEKEALEAQHDEIVVDEAATAVRAQVEVLVAELPWYQDRVGQLAQARAGLAALEQTARHRLLELGSQWDEARVEAVDISLTTTEWVRASEKMLAESVDRVHTACRALEAVRNKRAEVERMRRRLTTALNAEKPPPMDLLEEDARLLGRMEKPLGELHGQEASTRKQEAVVAARASSLHAIRAQRIWMPPDWIAGVGWWATLLGSLVVVLQAVDKGGFRFTAPAVFTVTSLLFAATTTCLLKRCTALDAKRQARLGVLRAACDSSLQDLQLQQERVARLRFTIQVAAARLLSVSLPSLPSSKDLQRCRTALADQRRRRQEWDRVQAAVAKADRALRRLDELQTQYEAVWNQARNQCEATLARWIPWKLDAALPETIAPGCLAALVDAVHCAREALAARSECRACIIALEHEVADWESRARGCLRSNPDLDDGKSDRGQLFEKLARLHDHCCRVREAQARRTRLAEDLSRCASKIELAERRLQAYGTERDRLLSDAKVRTEAEFHGRLATGQRREWLRASIEELERRTTGRLGQHVDGPELVQALATGHPSEWRYRAEQVMSELRRTEQERDELVRRHGDVVAALHDAVVTSASLAQIETRRACLVTELADAVREWRSLILAEELVDQMLVAFQLGQQPPCLARASKAFSVLTGSSHTALLPVASHGSLLIVHPEGNRKSVEELSQATLEQLYLCVRLGLVGELYQAGVRLPLIMDDVLVRFDSRRARSAAELIAQCAADNQVFISTCRPETVDLLRHVDPTTGVLELRPPGVAAQ